MSDSEDSKASLELEAVLTGLRSEGSLDSSGVFTVDLTKALPKLEKFQLPKPHFGLLKIVQSGVVAGADKIQCSFGTSAIRIEHNGKPPKPNELKEILSYLMAADQPPTERSLRDLAIGVNTALARGGSWVEVGVLHDGEWVSQRWTKRDKSEQTAIPQHQKSDMTTRFVMQRTTGQMASQAWTTASKKDIFDMLSKNRDSMDEDPRAIYDRCRHAPVDIFLDGVRLPDSPFGRVITKRWSPITVKQHRKANLLELYALCDEDSPHLLTPADQSQASLKLYREGRIIDGVWSPLGPLQVLPNQKLARRRCYTVAGIRHSSLSPGTVTLVKDGVDLTTMAPPNIPKGVNAIVSAEGLKLDLSHFRIVEGPEIAERLSWLSRFVGDNLRSAEKAGLLGSLSESERRTLGHLIERESIYD